MNEAGEFMHNPTQIILLAVCLAVLSAVPFVAAQEKRLSGLLLIRVDGKAGFIDRNGKVVIKPQYEGAQDFSEGLAPVKVAGKWGFINESGQFVIQPKFEWIYWSGFSEGIVPAGIDKKVGGIDRKGEFVIEPIYDMADEFSDGLMPVKLPGDQWDYSWIYVDITGRKAINKEFFGASSFVNGRAFVKVGFDKWALIDKTGNEITKQHFDSNIHWDVFSEGLTAVKVKNKWGYIDRNGRFVLRPRFDDANNFSEGLAAVRVGCSYGFIDKQGKLVIPAKFETAWKFSDGLAPVSIADESPAGLRYKSKGKWIQSCGFGFGSIKSEGYIDKTGKMVIEPVFGRAFPYSNGIAMVSFGEPPDVLGAIGKRGYIDKAGKYIWAPTE